MPLPPPDSPFGQPLQPEIRKDFMDAMMRLPAVLGAQMEGREGPIDIPMEQQAEVIRNFIFGLAQHVQNMAGRIDMLYSAVRELEEKVGGSQPGSDA